MEFNSPSTEHKKREEKQKELFKFSGKSQACCVCFIDIVSSTKTTAKIPPSKIAKFYSIFLNSMSAIIQQNHGVVVKTLGDAILYYFEKQDAEDLDYVQRAIACNFNLIKNRDHLNDLMHKEDLPSISFRISSDYGKVVIATSSISQGVDIFGYVTALCSMTNRAAETNGMIIGEGMYEQAKSLIQYTYELKKCQIQNSKEVNVYDVKFE